MTPVHSHICVCILIHIPSSRYIHTLPYPIFIFFCIHQLYLWGSLFWVRFLHIKGSRPEWCISSMMYSRDVPFWSETLNMWLLLNPTTEVVTFRLRGWCMLEVFFVAGIHPSRTSVRIFWVCAMKCMCTQTRLWFILSSKRVLMEWSQNPC